mgnify:FL=1
MKACFMEIAKLYDSSNGVVSIGTLLSKCAENQDLFPEYRETMTVEHDGTAFSYQVPYQHQLKPQEERFFKAQVESDRKLFTIFNIPDAENAPVRVNLTFPEFLALYQKRFYALSKKERTSECRGISSTPTTMNNVYCTTRTLQTVILFYIRMCRK